MTILMTSLSKAKNGDWFVNGGVKVGHWAAQNQAT